MAQVKGSCGDHIALRPVRLHHRSGSGGSASGLAEARQLDHCRSERPLKPPGCLFDVIVAAEVIEHLENSRALAGEWFRLLRPHGKLILSPPNNESWRSMLSLLFLGHYALFRSNSYPAHITPLLRCDIERCLTEAGFENPVFVFTDYGTLPKCPTVRWQTVSYGLLKGLRYSDNLLAMASKPNVS